MRSITVASPLTRRVLGLVLFGALALGLLLTAGASRGNAQGRAANAAGVVRSSGYAYAVAPAEVAVANAGANRSDGGSTTKTVVIVFIGLAVLGGAALEALYVRRLGRDDS